MRHEMNFSLALPPADLMNFANIVRDSDQNFLEGANPSYLWCTFTRAYL